MMGISVVIPHYNALRALERLLESLAVLDPPPGEIVVVDDGSHDVPEALCGRYPGARLVCMETNRGPSAARNRGAAAARGAILLFLDCDCEVRDPLLVARHLESHERSPGCIIVGGVAGAQNRTWFARGNHFFLWQDNIPDDKASGDLPASRSMSTAHFSVPRQVFEASGGFDERIRSSEDVTFWHDAVQRGVGIRKRSDLVVYHADLQSMRAQCRKIYEYGKVGPLVRGRTDIYGKLGPYLPRRALTMALAVPLFAGFMAYEAVAKWFRRRKEVVFFAPLFYLYGLAYGAGAVAAMRKRRTERGAAAEPARESMCCAKDKTAGVSGVRCQVPGRGEDSDPSGLKPET